MNRDPTSELLEDDIVGDTPRVSDVSERRVGTTGDVWATVLDFLFFSDFCLSARWTFVLLRVLRRDGAADTLAVEFFRLPVVSA